MSWKKREISNSPRPTRRPFQPFISPQKLLKKSMKKLLKGLTQNWVHTFSFSKERERGERGINSWGKKSTSPSQKTGRDRVVLLRPLHWCAHAHTPPCSWITWKQTRLLRDAWTSLIRRGDSAGMEEEERVEFYTAAERRESGVSPRGPGSQKIESVLGRSPSDRSSSGQYLQGYSRLRRTERGRFVYAESKRERKRGGLKSAKGLHCTSVITTFHLELG